MPQGNFNSVRETTDFVPLVDSSGWMLAATAIEISYPVVSRDTVFDSLSAYLEWPGPIWG